MALCLVFVIIALVFCVIEMFAPTLFCVNFAIGAIITAIISLFWGDLSILTLIFIVLSILSLVFIKPILTKFAKKDVADFSSQYVGKIVKAIEPITASSGAVTIYDERWEARTKIQEEIPAGVDVKIIANDSTILYVEKV